MGLKGRHGLGPNDAFLVVIFLNDNAHEPSNTYAIATHNRMFPFVIFIQESQLEILAILIAQIEDIAHLGGLGSVQNSFTAFLAFLTYILLGDFRVNTKLAPIAIEDIIFPGIG